jgi:hypothetical protein
VKIGLTLIRCGRCGKRHSNPFGHVCVTRMDRKRKPGATKLKIGVAAKCGRCGKPYGRNPLAHRCVTHTDWKKRRRKAEKAAKAKRPPRAQHDYQACRDGDCQRVACKAWKEAWEEGEREGYEKGHAAGCRDGYATGYAVGVAANAN